MHLDAATVAAAYSAGQEAWPRVGLARQTFAIRLASLQLSEQVITERAADLFLACACVERDPEAIRYFESNVMPQVDRQARRLGLSDAAIDEVHQRIRVKLLVGISPGITGYLGRGPLGAWVRVTAARIAIDVRRSANPARLGPDIELGDFGIAAGDDPERAAMRSIYREQLQTALEDSLRALSPRDKTLLRLSIVDGLGIDSICAIYRVHRATVARWIVTIRSRVFESMRQQIGLRAPPSHSEMRSLLLLLRDELHLSAAKILAPETCG